MSAAGRFLVQRTSGGAAGVGATSTSSSATPASTGAAGSDECSAMAPGDGKQAAGRIRQEGLFIAAFAFAFDFGTTRMMRGGAGAGAAASSPDSAFSEAAATASETTKAN